MCCVFTSFLSEKKKALKGYTYRNNHYIKLSLINHIDCKIMIPHSYCSDVDS